MQGKSINGFTLQRLLGTGGMAEVWYAENEIGLKVAVKILSDELSRNAQMRERFLNEAKVMVQLDNPYIRKVLGFGSIDDRPAIVMEYLEGDDLKARMKHGQRFTNEDLRKWWNQLVAALNYTHAQHIVHRDIKPSNIFINKNGDVKLLDFGIAKVVDSTSGTLTGSTLGTRIYMSPEQVRDPKRVGPKSDVYSLAVSFVHLLTGKAPYDSRTSSDYDIQESIVRKPLDLSAVPSAWRNFLMPYLEKDPAKRPELMVLKTLSDSLDYGIPSQDSFDETVAEDTPPVLQEKHISVRETIVLRALSWLLLLVFCEIATFIYHGELYEVFGIAGSFLVLAISIELMIILVRLWEKRSKKKYIPWAVSIAAFVAFWFSWIMNDADTLAIVAPLAVMVMAVLFVHRPEKFKAFPWITVALIVVFYFIGDDPPEIRDPYLVACSVPIIVLPIMLLISKKDIKKNYKRKKKILIQLPHDPRGIPKTIHIQCESRPHRWGRLWHCV